MKHYTTIEQSKKLLELGLNPDSADMFYEYAHNYEMGWEGYDDVPRAEPYNTYARETNDWQKNKEDIPCWSLGALLEVMPTLYTGDGDAIPFISKTPSGGYYVVYATISKEIDSTDICETPLEAAYNMVIWLLENGYVERKKV